MHALLGRVGYISRRACSMPGSSFTDNHLCTDGDMRGPRVLVLLLRFRGATIVRVIVREQGTTATETDLKRTVFLVDSLGWFRLELFAVARTIRLRTRRSGVRISPGAPLSLSVFNDLNT
jgi:hypothetical protein